MTGHDDAEDVMSSIRRLVGAGDPDGAEPDRLPILLLGPAVRVAEPEDAFQMIHRRASERAAPAAPAQPPRGGLADAMRVTGGEAALRAMVAEVVREELAGELGARITRNLRQLVLKEMRAANSGGAPSRPGPADGA